MQLLPDDGKIQPINSEDDWGSEDNEDLTNSTDATPSKPIITPTTSDVYFQYQNIPARPSNSLFPYPPLTAKETRTALENAPQKPCVPRQSHKRRYLQWKAELFLLHRPLIFTGFGSKRGAIDDFVRELSGEYDVITIDAFNPSITFRGVLEGLLAVHQKSSIPSSTPTDELMRSVQLQYSRASTPRIVAVLHSMDALTLHARKNVDVDKLKRVLGSERISVVASVDHLNAPLLFPAHDAAVGLPWLWHDLSTLEPHLMEMAQRATSLLHSSQAASSTGIVPTVSGARHVIASVPDRARRLFVAIAQLQLERCSEGEKSDATAQNTSTTLTPSHASPRHALVSMAKQSFIATSEDAFEAALAEFRDHGLIQSSSSPPSNTHVDGPEQYIWIPLDQRSLRRTLEDGD
ncbi:hypothetical protein E3P84_03919 [Wallemia ichthyophaga]|nr:hypothetical protein E3P84_03919 [Wallemia ichthyophaga]TIB38599.1 hypothetical protein E3P83_03923 [Wallemia ichthyophaga]